MYTHVCVKKNLDTVDRKYREIWICLPTSKELIKKYKNYLIVDSIAEFDIDMSDRLELVNKKAIEFSMKIKGGK